MSDGYHEVMGVNYRLSATSESATGWVGIANIRTKIAGEYGEHPLNTPSSHRSAEQAMVVAEEQLKLLCSSGALRQIVPNAYYEGL